MAKEMLINVSEGEECRIALLEDGRLDELYMERTSSTSHVGNIYKGRVTNVEPSIQAAFVDFGLGRNGFLHISDLMPTYFGRRGEDIQESVGRKMARRDRPPIQRCLRRGDEITVQIIKEGIGTKGPTLSTYLSIAGKMLVMMPGMGKMGVSKKIEDDQERRRLRQILDGLKPPKDVAFIIRTAGIGKSKVEIERDLKYLTRLWEILKKKEKEPGPVELYTEGDLVTRTVRDSIDVDRIIVDNDEVAKRVKEVIKISSPRAKNKVELYQDPVPLFHKFEIEKEIELMYSRHVPLPSGGSLVIDSTEAIVAIDVNSGKFRDHNDAEMTAFKTDMEAADEIPRQLKLRDLGGVIIVDFIDLRFERHRRELEERLNNNFANDRAKTKVLRMSQFGIIELTRQRMRPSLKRSIYFDCPHCKGAGLVKTPESMSLDVMRKLAIALSNEKVVRAELSVCSDIAFYLLNKKRAALTDLEIATKKKVLIRTDATLSLDEQRFELFDLRDGAVILEEIGMTLASHPHTTQLGKRPPGHTPQGRGNRQNNQRGPNRGVSKNNNNRGRDQRPPQTRDAEEDREEMDEDRLAIERGENAVDEREEQMGYAPNIIRQAPDEREEDSVGPEMMENPSDNDIADDEIESDSESDLDSDSESDSEVRSEKPAQENRPPQQQPGAQQQPRPQKVWVDEGPVGPMANKMGGGRRRRGRRGRGGGGGGGQNQNNNRPGQPNNQPNRPPQNRPVDDESIGNVREPDVEELDDETIDQMHPNGNAVNADGSPREVAEGDQPRRRRRRRGGRRHRRRNGQEGFNNTSGGPNENANGPLVNEEPIGEESEFTDEHPGENDEPAEVVETPVEVAPEPVEVAEPAPEVEEEAPKPKRGRKPKAAAGPKKAKAPAKEKKPKAVKATAKRTPPKSSAKRETEEPKPAPVVRTGSADKHLASDEPVIPSSVSRLRSYRDLDAIPDDYD